MSEVALGERELGVIVRVLVKICERTGADYRDVFEEAAREIAGNCGDAEDAPSLLANLRVPD